MLIEGADNEEQTPAEESPVAVSGPPVCRKGDLWIWANTGSCAAAPSIPRATAS